MYNSPITIFEKIDNIINSIEEQRENAIVAKIQETLAIDVDKDELVRALNYDRGQYDRGYQDGHRNGVAVGRQQILDELYTFMQKQGYEFEEVEDDPLRNQKLRINYTPNKEKES